MPPDLPRPLFLADRTLAGATVAAVLALAALTPSGAQAAELAARFDGGIGVQPLTAGALPNVVNDTQPALRPWVIEKLHAEVFADGRFDVRGQGLLLAGTGNVGRTNNLSVRIRLYCGEGPTLVSFTSAESVQLEPDGDFRLRGEFAVVNQPLVCANATLLVLNAGTGQATPGGWFAAGIPKL